MDRNKSIIMNVWWKFAERILAQIITLLVSIVLARLLAPEDFGAISIVIVFINIANTFVVGGIPTSLIQKKDTDYRDFSSVFYFNMCFSLLVYVVLFVSSPIIANFYGYPVLSPVLRVLGIRILVAGVNSVQHAYVSKNMMFKKYFWSTLFGTLFSGAIGILMAYFHFGIWSLVAQYMLNTTIDTIILFITVKWRPTLFFEFRRIKELFGFGWKMLFEGVSSTVSDQIRNLLIGKVYSSSELAYYTRGQQFPSVIVTNISTSIGAVLFPAMSNEQDQRDRVLRMLRKSVQMSTYVVYPLLIGLAAIAPSFVRVVLTEKWSQTIPYLQAFCLLSLPTVGMIPRHQALTGTGRSDIFMKEHIIARVIGFIILFYTYKFSIMAIIIGDIFSTLLLTIIISYTSQKYNGYNYYDQLHDIAPSIIGCIIMGIIVYLLNYIELNPIIKLTTQIIIGFLIYVLYSHLMKIKEYDICKKTLISMLRKWRVNER